MQVLRRYSKCSKWKVTWRLFIASFTLHFIAATKHLLNFKGGVLCFFGSTRVHIRGWIRFTIIPCSNHLKKETTLLPVEQRSANWGEVPKTFWGTAWACSRGELVPSCAEDLELGRASFEILWERHYSVTIIHCHRQKGCFENLLPFLSGLK